VTFFPQLIAGPIVHHKEMMPQFETIKNKLKNYKHIAAGIFVFSIGLFKKICIADTFAIWATAGFDHSTTLNFIEAWVTAFSYTFQLYFDFSGYTDMAIGGALLFNIKLPINFNSPYKALNIQDFWRRWHITLSRFLRDYIYIPFGGNKKGELITYRNLLLVFLIGGLWHGAGWTFIFWGFLHGVALVIQRIWNRLNIKLHHFWCWYITFNFVTITWVFFRATSWDDAIKVLKGMFGLSGIVLPDFLENFLFFLQDIGIQFLPYNEIINVKKGFDDYLILLYILLALLVVCFAKNSVEMLNDFKPNLKTSLFVAILFIFSFILMYKAQNSEFLYFNF
jgi:D-alanyl-lipoteichoic acid acyltransferase DltB (MBOAT superfamily)